MPVQLMHSVLSSLGPVPAAQAEHVVFSALTTFGALQSMHSIPKVEYVVPSQCSHSERSAEGTLPAIHASQNKAFVEKKKKKLLPLEFLDTSLNSIKPINGANIFSYLRTGETFEID